MSWPPEPSSILADAGIHAAEPVRITTGLSGIAIWRAESAEGPLAIRCLPPYWREVLAREITSSSLAQAVGLPAPTTLARGEIDGAPYLVSNWLPGIRLSEWLVKHPWQAGMLAREMGALQARMHAIEVSGEDARSLGDWRYWPVDPSEATLAMLDAVSDGIPHLLHLDFHPDNILIADGKISALIDWTNARAGDPRADLARTAILLQYGPRLAGWRVRLARPLIDQLYRGWQASYWQAAGVPRNLGPFLLWAGQGFLEDLRPKLDMPDLAIDRTTLIALLDTLEADIGRWEMRLHG